jgi:hypothetical protein
MAERTQATAYQPLNLTCSVEAQAPYQVYWRHGERPVGGPFFYQCVKLFAF